MTDLEALLILNAFLLPKAIYELIQFFGSSSAVFKVSAEALGTCFKINPEQVQKILNWSKVINIENEIKRIERSRTKIVPFWSEEYPKILSEIPSAPVVLYVSGKYMPSHQGGVGMVGSRAASLYGKRMTKYFAEVFAQNDIAVISGLARGIDCAAHEGAMIPEHGRTFAVIGSGLGYMLNHESLALADQIQERGALISEFPWDRVPSRYSFPQRNRIISGLSKVTCVMEASKKSGALITADYALEHSRLIFALPGPIDSSRSQGTNALIKDGAQLLDTPEDLLKEFNKTDSMFRDQNKEDAIQFSGLAKNVFDLLAGSSLTMDEIVVETGERLSVLYKILLDLELKGAVKQLPGKVFVRNSSKFKIS